MTDSTKKKLTKFLASTRNHTPIMRTAFSVIIEMLEIVGFVIGFVAVVQLPAKNMIKDVAEITDDWKKSMHAVREEIKILVDSSIESRTLGFIAMIFIVAAFILRTFVSRVIRMRSDL